MMCSGTQWGLCVGCCLGYGLSDGPALSVSLLCARQVITLEGWVEIMYYVMDAHSFYNFIYFILLIIVSVREPRLLGALRT